MYPINDRQYLKICAEIAKLMSISLSSAKKKVEIQISKEWSKTIQEKIQVAQNVLKICAKNEKISNIIAFKRIILLVGSRYPEALKNLDNFLDCLQDFDLSEDLVILLPLSTNAKVIKIQSYLNKYGFIKQSKVKFLIDEDSVWKKKDQYLVIGKGKFNSWANMAEVGLSNAGTPTEQIAGLGIPSLSLPGPGPQFTKSFAKRQSRLLGGSVLVCKNKKILLKRLSVLLKGKVDR